MKFEALIPKIAIFIAEATDAGNIILMLQNAGFEVTFEKYNASRQSKKDYLHTILLRAYQSKDYDLLLKFSELLIVKEYFREDYEYKYDLIEAKKLSKSISVALSNKDNPNKKWNEKKVREFLFDVADLHKGIVAVSKEIFIDGHYEQAVAEGCKFLENYIQNKIDKKDLIGRNLVNEAFAGENPPLKIYSDLVDKNKKSEQEGFHLLCLGEILFLKNRLSHQEKGSIVRSRSQALKILALHSIILETIDTMVNEVIVPDDIPF